MFNNKERDKMTDQANILIWFYDDLGKVKSVKLGKFLDAENKRKSLGNSAQNFYATKKLAIKKRNQVYKNNPNTAWIARWKI
jgi:hypothetical protein